MSAYPLHPREWSQPTYTHILDGRRPPTPPPTVSTVSPPLHQLHHHNSSSVGGTGTEDILTPPLSPQKPAQQQAKAQSHSPSRHRSSDSGVGLSSYPGKFHHASSKELSKPYPLFSTIPLSPYQGTSTLCDLLDDVLESMTEFTDPPLPPPPPPEPPHPGTPVMLSPPVQARPISLLRCTNVPVDDEYLARYTRGARAFVRRVEGGIGMWGLGRFMAALRGDGENADEAAGVGKISPVCSLLALRDGEDSQSYGASIHERLTNVKVDVRVLLEEVAIGLRELGVGVSDEEKGLAVVQTGKRDDSWERKKLERLAQLVEMLLASLIPAIEEYLVEGMTAREEPGMRAFVPEGVVGRAGTPFIRSGGTDAAYYTLPTSTPEQKKRSAAPSTIRTTTPSPTPPSAQPQRTTSFQLPPTPHRPPRPPSSTSSLRATYSRQASDLKPPQLDRLSTITANTTATGDTFVYLEHSMQRAAVEGIREEELGIGRPGNWGGSVYDFDEGAGGGEVGGKKWWKWGGKKKAAGKEKIVKELNGDKEGAVAVAAAPEGEKKRGWKRFLCFGGE